MNKVILCTLGALAFSNGSNSLVLSSTLAITSNPSLVDQNEHAKIGDNDLPELLKLLTNLEAKAKNPLFKMHLMSLRTMIEDTTHEVQWETQDSLWISNALRFFENEGSNWSTYANGPKPLVMSFLSPTDGKNSYYRLYLPNGFDQTIKDYPFYMELHGSGSGKNDNPRKMLLQPYQPERQGITLQGFRGEGLFIQPWGRGDKGYRDQAEIDIYECLNHFDDLFETDPKRQYLYGFSMGSMGTFRIALKNMDRWAAFGIYLGAGKDISQEQANLFKNKPVWIVWGEEERMAEQIQLMKDYLIEGGAEVVFYEVKGVGHSYLSEYQEKLMDWLKEKSK